MSLIDKHFPTGDDYSQSTDIFRDFDRMVNDMERPSKRRSEAFSMLIDYVCAAYQGKTVSTALTTSMLLALSMGDEQ